MRFSEPDSNQYAELRPLQVADMVGTNPGGGGGGGGKY